MGDKLPPKLGLVPKNPEFSNIAVTQTPGQAAVDSGRRYCQVDLCRHIDSNHIAVKMAVELEAVTAIRRSTILLAGIGVFSAALCRLVGIERHGRFVPSNLLVVLEQPSGTGKSRVINSFLYPLTGIIRDGFAELKQRMNGVKADSDEGQAIVATRKMLTDLNNSFDITNATPEGIEKDLSLTSGYFGCISSEQGLFNSLFGLSYGDGKKAGNNDLILNAFDAGTMKVKRAGRGGFSGQPVGAVVLFSQSGGIDSLLQSSQNSGLSERFLKLAEEPKFNEPLQNRALNLSITGDYDAACQRVFREYIQNGAYTRQPPPWQLPWMRISSHDHTKITDLYSDNYRHFGEGGRHSAEAQRGFVSKCDMQVCKIAAVLHAMESGIYPEQIDSKHVDSAIGIVSELIESHIPLLGEKGMVGDVSAYKAIISYLDNRKYPLSTIKQNCRNKIPFRNHSGNVATYISETIDRMVRSRLLVVEIEPATGKELISVA